MDSLSPGQLIAEFRRAAGLTQLELARALNYRDGSWISRIESGASKSPSREQILLISDGLSLTDTQRSALLLSAGFRADGAVDEILTHVVQELSAVRMALESLAAALAQPRSFLPTDLDQFARGADELWMSGTTLYSLPLRFGGFLSERLRAGMSARFVVSHPDILRNAPIREGIVARRGFQHASFEHELDATYSMFRSLQPLADPARFAVFGYLDVQHSGLTLVNPQTAEAKGRSAMYLEKFPLAFNPTTDFDASIPGQVQFVHALKRNFQVLVEESERLI